MCCDGNGDVHSVHGLLSEHTGGRFTVLVFQCILHILYGKSEVGQLGRVYPDLHGIVTATDIGNTSYSRNTAEQIKYVQRGEVTQVDFVKLRVVGSQAESHQLAWSLLLHRNTILNHFCGQSGFRQFDTVLDFHGCQVWIGGDVESNCGRETSGVGTAGFHVKHARCSVEFLFDRGSYCLRYGHGTGSRIGSTDFDYGGSNLRVLVDRQHHQANDTYDYNQYGDDGREYGPVNEKADFHA